MYRKNRWIRAARDVDPEEPAAGGGGAPTDEGGDGGAETGGNAPESGKDDADKPLRPEGERALRRVKDENESLKKKLQEIEDAKLSKEDKLSKDFGETKEKLTVAERTVLQLEVALDKGLTKKQALRLVGNTREELEADADDLRETFSTAADRIKKKPEALRGGGAPEDDEGAIDPAKLAAKVRERSGRMYVR
ncbi:hypothetical protein ACWEOE_10865 [Amycolatopsis sp. NPDC004368]